MNFAKPSLRPRLAPVREKRPTRRRARGPVTSVSVVIPTRNEADNIVKLLDELGAVLPGDAEVIFVDDSDTADTQRAIEAECSRRSLRIVVIHRPEGERPGGLSGAVVRGLDASTAPWVCVMDADLQHPPALVPQMLARAQAGGVDVVVASRYCGTTPVDSGDDAAEAFGPARHLLSRVSTRAAQLLFPRSLRGVSDPMSGFFLLRRSAAALDRLHPRGFKILLELLVRSRDLRVAEIPFRFGTRNAGESKASATEAVHYLVQLLALRVGGTFGRFLLVGLTGLAVNTLVFLFFTEELHLNYLLAAVLSTQFSTTWNFLLAEHWVFGHRDINGRRGVRFWTFLALNNLSLLLRGPLLYLLVSVAGIHPAVANLLSLVAITLARFAVADTVIWSSPDRRSAQRLYSYRIHDEVTVESPIALRELERFRVRESIGRPTVRVRCGRLSRQQSDLVSVLMSRLRHIRYDEGLGGLGFAIDISCGRYVDIVASPLLRRSPHVLYTNVVEPTLRWAFVKRGYALAHAACISVDGRATLITALTDTGKTTTILKTLDRYPAAFLSDDLTLICPDGRVLSYPKPLTISRHTVAAVQAPLLTHRERLALVFQSRLHSRTGRQFGQLLARMKLPVATINALVQFVVPPPKYHVERLVPGVETASHAQLGNLVVIERGGTGRQDLEHEEAVDFLVSNTDDAYGFPPYPSIEHFLHSGNGRDLRSEERAIIAAALEGVVCLKLRSETMDWWQRIPALAGLGEAPREPHAPDAVGEPAQSAI